MILEILFASSPGILIHPLDLSCHYFHKFFSFLFSTKSFHCFLLKVILDMIQCRFEIIPQFSLFLQLLLIIIKLFDYLNFFVIFLFTDFFVFCKSLFVTDNMSLVLNSMFFYKLLDSVSFGDFFLFCFWLVRVLGFGFVFRCLPLGCFLVFLLGLWFLGLRLLICLLGLLFLVRRLFGFLSGFLFNLFLLLWLLWLTCVLLPWLLSMWHISMTLGFIYYSNQPLLW